MLHTKSTISRNEMNERARYFLDKFSKRVTGTPPGVCPIATILSFVRTAASQTCGKCVPCRDGLPQLAARLEQLRDGTLEVPDGETPESVLERIYNLAIMIRDASDCAIGYEAAYVVLKSMETFKDEFESHIREHRCIESVGQKIPCVSFCPANVNIPGYISLVEEGRYADAISLIRQDNPFVTACAYVCEHPCESKCRRNLIDNAINIRGIKKYAVDKIHVDKVPVPIANNTTGKTISVIGAGPSGLTAAFFLARMGHKVVVYEGREKMGGMLRYGIPNYRLPKDRLDEDINAILSAGNIEVHCNTQVNKDIPMKEIVDKSDAVYIAIGAQLGSLVKMEGIESKGVDSAVEMLGEIGRGNIPDYKGKSIVVVGGGNVAMDCARSAVRCGAKEVTLVYRGRQADMTALPEEIQGAVEEGVELMTMHAPLKILADEKGCVKSFIAQPQMVSTFRPNGRPSVKDADREPVEIKCDVVLMAVGQTIDSSSFAEYSVNEKRGTFTTEPTTLVKGYEKIFAGGDCVFGPATAIKAIAAGKIAAINIDEALGYHHKYLEEIDIPIPKENTRKHYGSVLLTFRPARERKNDFNEIENGMSYEEAKQECSKCLRCDHFGCGVLQGGRV